MPLGSRSVAYSAKSSLASARFTSSSCAASGEIRSVRRTATGRPDGASPQGVPPLIRPRRRCAGRPAPAPNCDDAATRLRPRIEQLRRPARLSGEPAADTRNRDPRPREAREDVGGPIRGPDGATVTDPPAPAVEERHDGAGRLRRGRQHDVESERPEARRSGERHRRHPTRSVDIDDHRGKFRVGGRHQRDRGVVTAATRNPGGTGCRRRPRRLRCGRRPG